MLRGIPLHPPPPPPFQWPCLHGELYYIIEIKNADQNNMTFSRILKQANTV